MNNLENLPLFAIFRNDVHISNSIGLTPLDAIKRHLIDADLGEFTEDVKLLKLFTAKKAAIGIHFHYSKLHFEIFGQRYLDRLKLNE